MSWFQSACPRCHGMMFVPATFLGHAVVCDKCGVTFVPNPIAPQTSASMPYAAPPLPPQQIPQPIGYGMPSSYPPPAYYPSSAPHRPPEPPPSDYSYPTVPTPPPTLPRASGERQDTANPFGSPLPEIEILPPPNALRQSSRRRPNGSRSSGSKRSRSPSAEAATSPKRDGDRERRRRSKRKSRAAAAPLVSEEAARAAREEVELVERRLRRAKQRRNVSLALVAIGMVAMSLVAYLMITHFRPTRSTLAEPTTTPAMSTIHAASSARLQATRSYPSDLPRS